MPPQSPESEERVTIVLPWPLEDAERTSRLTRHAARERWAPEEYAAARAAAAELERAAAELERGEFVPPEPDPALLRDVVQALAAHPAMRGVLGMAEPPPPDAVPYVSLS